MVKYIFILIIINVSSYVIADGVDVAKIKVNGKLHRQITRHRLDGPFLINLSKYQLGDTLDIDIWTDHYAQRNCFVTIKNLENEFVDTLNSEHSCVISEKLINQNHLITVTYIYDVDTPEEHKVSWEICKIINDERIEKIYNSINDFRDFLISYSAKKTGVNKEMLSDSISTNFIFVIGKNGELSRIEQDTLTYSNDKLSKILKFTKEEISFMKSFNSIDYSTLFDRVNKIYGSIFINEITLDSYVLKFGSYQNTLNFHVVLDNGIYKLKSVFYEKIKWD